MRRPIALLFAVLAITALVAACEWHCWTEEGKNGNGTGSSDLYMKLSPSRSSVAAGSAVPISLVASVSADASGESCSFEATSGSFSQASTVASTVKTVDVYGKASAYWFAPAAAGTAWISATVGAVGITVEITVTP